jgi:1-acyl-sn-glycerol-3-phosphate acyltransferase
MFYVRLLITLCGFLVATVYGIGAALVRRDRSRLPHQYARLLARLTQRPLGVRRLEVVGEENLYRERPCIYIANHQSNFDVPVLGAVYPSETVVIGKKELRSVPLFGWLFAATGNILIDRSDREQAVGRLKAVTDEMRRRGVSVWIFPEGTRGRQPGEMLPFKKGAFQMAIAAQCPLVPVVASPLRCVIDTAARRIRPGTVEIRILEPIPTKGLTEADLDDLMDRTYQRMTATLQEMAARRGLPTSARATLQARPGGD